MMSRSFYAFLYTHGRSFGTDGNAAVYVFPTRQARDAWVAAGPAYLTANGYREEAPASHKHVRRAKREGWLYRDEETV